MKLKLVYKIHQIHERWDTIFSGWSKTSSANKYNKYYDLLVTYGKAYHYDGIGIKHERTTGKPIYGTGNVYFYLCELMHLNREFLIMNSKSG